MEFRIKEIIDPRIINILYKVRRHIRGLQEVYLICLSNGKLFLVYPREKEVPVLIRGKSNKKLSRLRTNEVELNVEKNLRAIVGSYWEYESNLMFVEMDDDLYWTLYYDSKTPVEDLSVIITMLSKIEIRSEIFIYRKITK